jgi:hypothetical protein
MKLPLQQDQREQHHHKPDQTIKDTDVQFIFREKKLNRMKTKSHKEKAGP